MICQARTLLRPYIVMFAGCVQCIAAEAYRWGNRETGGPLYGLFSHANRPVLMLAAPGGPEVSLKVVEISAEVRLRKHLPAPSGSFFWDGSARS